MAPGGIFSRIGGMGIEIILGCLGYFHAAPLLGLTIGVSAYQVKNKLSTRCSQDGFRQKAVAL